MSAYDLAIRWLIVSSAALLAWALIELAWEHLMTDPNPAQRGWFHANYECVMPTDSAECDTYEAELAQEAIHGPAAGQEMP
jgi:hypothetical protein